MTKWAQSLIRLSGYEVETLQKRLAEITTRRAVVEMRIAVLDAEAVVERERCAADPEANVWWGAYHAGWTRRRDEAVAELDAIAAEEAGARDALARAFEEQKKFEHVAELSRLAELSEASRRETAEMDEAGRQRAAR